ncbi:GTPase-activating protein gyp1 [Diplonema papillatum]|nr:GTPase-activating protein gyp1 [Diplonema papillatum]
MVTNEERPPEDARATVKSRIKQTLGGLGFLKKAPQPAPLRSNSLGSTARSDDGQSWIGRNPKQQAVALGGMSHHNSSIVSDDDADNSTSSLQRKNRLTQYLECDSLALGDTNSDGLRSVCWNGIPVDQRPQCWRLLCGYLPTSSERRDCDLQRKRQEYKEYVAQYFQKEPRGENQWMSSDIKLVKKDVPRTSPDIPFFQLPVIQNALERILVVWAHRHPASGYVQGMNDLVMPFLYVFSAEFVDRSVLLSKDAAVVSEAVASIEALLPHIEADSFWCYNKLLSHIQDHYTDGQPGIQSKLAKLDAILKQVDPELHVHLQNEQVFAVQFAFRWFNCLFVREFPLPLLTRLWDTFLCEGDGFPDLQVYMCVALLENWSPLLLKMDFAEIMGLLQCPPTAGMPMRELGEINNSCLSGSD